MQTDRTWVVVADGGAARFFERVRPGVQLRELGEMAMSAAAEVQARDRPARVHESAGVVRHGVESRTSPHEAAEMRFLQALSATIEKAAEARAFDLLILCAPPRALGIVRGGLDRARGLLAATVAKDLMHETPDAIAARIDKIGG